MPADRDKRHPTSSNGVVVALGLLFSQIGATFLVRSANLTLQGEMATIIAKGYVAVPSARVVDGLSSWFNAFMGAIFFTLTTGILLVFITLAAMRWIQATKWSLSRQLGILAALWLVLIAFLNSTGLNNGATQYVTAVMVAVIAAGSAFRRRVREGEKRFRRAAVIFTPLILLTGLWATRLDADLFTNIRDRLLFSNPVGVKVVEFYYDYTLYGAQAMAPLTQHTLLGVDMSAVRPDADYSDLADALSRRDVLDVGDAPAAAAVLTPEGEGIRWQDDSGAALSARRKDILQGPDSVVKRFSEAADRNGPFRLLTLFGILLGFPVFLYLTVFVVMERLLAIVFGRYAVALTAVMCLVIGGALFYPLAAAPTVGIKDVSAMDLWKQGGLPQRISVLKQAGMTGTDPLRYPDADALSHSARLAERYWFARALSSARSARGFELLERMMNDASTLVICQVCYAFGEMKNPRAIPILLSYIQNSDYWYAQRYAYTALKKLGWTQPPHYR